ncbi:MAG TPA: tetratricopeptide repeat protein [Thermoanaerobaculia bacterium]|nr:tetratricopeptide repeat protein [Thermoanaerobaculia bacterium]
MSRHRTVASLLILLILIPSLAFAARKGRLVGRVIDAAGKPVEGVTVTVTSPEIAGFKEIRTTDKKGTFTVDFAKIDVRYEYKFEKTGYQTVSAGQTWSKEGTEFFDWTIPAAEIVVDTGAPVAAPPVTSSQAAIDAYNRGVSALKAKDFATAAVNFREAVKQDPNLRLGWAALSAAELESKNYEAAVAAAEKAIALGSTDEAVFLARYRSYQSLKNEAKAAEALKDLEKIGRRSEEAKRIHNEAVALVKAGDHAGAFAKFQEALKVDPNLAASQLGLATAAVKIGKDAEAAAAAESILKADPGNEAAIRIRFNAALKLGEKKRLYDALVDLAPFEPKVARDGILKLAFEAYDANENTVAKERFGKVLQLDPNYPQAYYYLGVINAGQGATAEARKQLERFLQLAPKDPEAESAREMLRYLGK